jgi:DNA primase
LVYDGHVELRRSGKTLVGLCCFHSEKTPSFTVSAKLRFKCWGCDKEGSAFDFVMAVERTDFRGALERLAAKAGIAVNGTRPKQPPKNIERPSATESHAPAITIADLACDKKIPESELARMGIKNVSNGVLIPYYLSDKSLVS